MYETDEIKRRLDMYRRTERDIENQIARIEMLEVRIENVGSPALSGTSKSPGPYYDRTPDLISKKIELEETLEKSKKKQQDELHNLETLISSLNLPDEKAVIRLRYFDCLAWSDVVYCLFGSRRDYLDKEETYTRRIHKLHKSALINLARIINSAESVGESTNLSSQSPLQEVTRQIS